MDSGQHTESLNRPLHAAGITLNSTGQFPINAAAVVQPVSIPWSNKNLDAGGAPFLLEGFAQTRLREFADREWPVIKGLGGYASETLSPLGYLRVLLSRDWAHRFLDYGLGSFQKRLEFVARRRR